MWPQEPVGAVLVAGDMAIAVDVQGESIVWDLQKVPNIAVLARYSRSGTSILSARLMMLQGEILQNHLLHTGVQAAACTRFPLGVHHDMVFVGTCTGELHMFMTPASC